jgi:hypothetical protein
MAVIHRRFANGPALSMPVGIEVPAKLRLLIYQGLEQL